MVNDPVPHVEHFIYPLSEQQQQQQLSCIFSLPLRFLSSCVGRTPPSSAVMRRGHKGRGDGEVFRFFHLQLRANIPAPPE